MPVMIRARIAVRKLAARHKNLGFAGGDLAELFRSLAEALFDPYRPELHYMRGPGPKWHAKHRLHEAVEAAAVPTRTVPARASGAIAAPALIRCG